MNHIIFYHMYKVDKDFTWDKYFKQCGIYQGRSWHDDLKELFFKIKDKLIDK